MDREHGSPNIRVSAAVWRCNEPKSLELATIDRTDQGFELSGDVAVDDNNISSTINYQINVDHMWATRSVSVTVKRGGAMRSQLQLEVNETHEWSIRRASGESFIHQPEFDGLVDIDMSCTPATNLLPIRRFSLAIGESHETTAVWITFPGLEIQKLPQRYTRLTAREYRYESFLTGFEAVLQVDDFGVVDRYADVWDRLNSQTRPAP